MNNSSFSYKEPLAFGWRTVKKKIWFFAGLFLILLALSLSGSWLGNLLSSEIPESIWPFDYAAVAVYHLVYLYEVI